MRKLTFIFLFSLILSNSSLFAETWSGEMGMMYWKSANALCRSKGMRLPTLGELEAAFEVGLTKSWRGYFYWSSTPYDAEWYYMFHVRDGSATYGLGHTSSASVRCRR